MDSVHYLNSIPAEADYEKILFRMGYRAGVTKVASSEKQRIDAAVAAARGFCALKGAYVRLQITARAADSVTLENNSAFKSAALAKLLEKSGTAVLMGSTAGAAVVEERDRLMKEGKAADAVVFDAVASETADTGLDWLKVFFNSRLAQAGRGLTTRYSPGYGDLGLDAQKTIHDALALDKIGIAITEKFILIPEKSVIAMAGIE